MIQPKGFEAVHQRIQEIESKLRAFQPKTETAPGQADFDSILTNQLQSDSSTPAPENLTSVESLQNLVGQTAQKVGLDPNLAKAVAKAESAFNPNAVSKAGAQGLMQLMPETAQGLGVKTLLDPKQNVEGGTKYLKSLIDKYHSVPQAVAAYNAGPSAVNKYGGIPPYSETQNYVKRVLQYQREFEAQDGGAQ